MTNAICKIYPSGLKRWTIEPQESDKLGPRLNHREGGPAIEASDGRREHHLDGIEYSKAEYFDKVTREQQAKLIFNPEFMR
jgi:hypothetical protein